MTRPSITVGIPVWNGEAFLAEALDSVLAQDVEDLEVLVSDNASTDATPDICREYACRDPRIRVVRQEVNVGAAANFNLLVRGARAPLYKSLSHDDRIEPAFLSRCRQALDDRPSAVLAFAGTRIIDERGATVDVDDGSLRWRNATTPSGRLRDLFDVHEQSYLHHCFPVMGVMRTDVLRSTQLIQPFPSSDTVLLVELALRGDFVEVPEVLSNKRRHAGTSIEANPDPASRALWFDPANAGRPATPRTDLLRAYSAAVWQAPLRPGERAQCLAEVARWTARERRWRVIGGELRRRRAEPPTRDGADDAPRGIATSG